MLYIKFIIYIKNKYIINPCAIKHTYNRPFPSSPNRCFKARVGAQPLIWKSFFILMQIKLIFTRKRVLVGLTDRRKTAKNLVDGRE